MPRVTRSGLIRLAGLVWVGVGVALISVASRWFATAHEHIAFLLSAGLATGFLVYRFKLVRLAAKNIGRIRALTPDRERLPVFAFQNARSYILIALMMAMGHFLRHLPVPRVYLATLYMAMGLGLLLAGSTYFRHAAPARAERLK